MPTIYPAIQSSPENILTHSTTLSMLYCSLFSRLQPYSYWLLSARRDGSNKSKTWSPCRKPARIVMATGSRRIRQTRLSLYWILTSIVIFTMSVLYIWFYKGAADELQMRLFPERKFSVYFSAPASSNPLMCDTIFENDRFGAASLWSVIFS